MTATTTFAARKEAIDDDELFVRPGYFVSQLTAKFAPGLPSYGPCEAVVFEHIVDREVFDADCVASADHVGGQDVQVGAAHGALAGKTTLEPFSSASFAASYRAAFRLSFFGPLSAGVLFDSKAALMASNRFLPAVNLLRCEAVLGEATVGGGQTGERCNAEVAADDVVLGSFAEARPKTLVYHAGIDIEVETYAPVSVDVREGGKKHAPAIHVSASSKHAAQPARPLS